MDGNSMKAKQVNQVSPCSLATNLIPAGFAHDLEQSNMGPVVFNHMRNRLIRHPILFRDFLNIFLIVASLAVPFDRVPWTQKLNRERPLRLLSIAV